GANGAYSHLRLILAVTVTYFYRRDFFPRTQTVTRRATGPRRYWSWADFTGAGVDCAGRNADHPGKRRSGDLCLADRRYSAGCADWRDVRHYQLLQPCCCTADCDSDRRRHYLLPRGALSGDWC